MYLPLDALHDIIYLVGILGIEVKDRLQDADGCAQMEVGTVHHGLVTGKRYHTATYLDVVGTQLGKFLCQYLLQSLESLGDEFKCFQCRIYLNMYANNLQS